MTLEELQKNRDFAEKHCSDDTVGPQRMIDDHFFGNDKLRATGPIRPKHNDDPFKKW